MGLQAFPTLVPGSFLGERGDYCAQITDGAGWEGGLLSYTSGAGAVGPASRRQLLQPLLLTLTTLYPLCLGIEAPGCLLTQC